MYLLRPLRLSLAKRAHAKARATLAAYQGQPADGQWSHPIACALLKRAQRAEAKVCRLMGGC